VCDEATAKNFNVLVGEDIEFIEFSEESTELDDQIQWEKLGGVTKLDKKTLLYNFIFIYIFFTSHQSLPASHQREANKLFISGLKNIKVSLPERLR
jgi:hypothetical protein